MDPNPPLERLSSAELLSATRDLVRRSQDVEAEILLHLGEIDERKLYLECAPHRCSHSASMSSGSLRMPRTTASQSR